MAQRVAGEGPVHGLAAPFCPDRVLCLAGRGALDSVRAWERVSATEVGWNGFGVRGGGQGTVEWTVRR